MCGDNENTNISEDYKNGYEKGFEDALTQSSLREPSSRVAKWDLLRQELLNWGYSEWSYSAINVMKAIANELSWRMIMRVVHKLRRKRGCNNDV